MLFSLRLLLRKIFWRPSHSCDPLRNAQFDAMVPVLGVATMGALMLLRSPARLENIGRAQGRIWASWVDVDGQ